ncbi:MAG: hypothetical protein HON39_00820 [Marinovum sp.]|nr:hypothetical protein [Marinovum sp.]
MDFVTKAALDAAITQIKDAPKDDVPIETLCFRPGFGARQFPNQIEVTRRGGITGERWLKAPWMKLPDGAPDPAIQVSILGLRVHDAVRFNPQNMLHPGDTIVADLDCSKANMPTGTLLKIGSAALRVSGVFNTACVKWKARYGAEAFEWINTPKYRPIRLRGLLCSVYQDGEISKEDRIVKRGVESQT